MEIYVTYTEVKRLWKSSLDNLIRECRYRKVVPERLVELIKHNLYAKYVCYDPVKELIEIGVNESLISTSTYPVITVSSFPLEQLEEKLENSCQSKKADMEFYAKILSGKNLNDRMVLV